MRERGIIFGAVTLESESRLSTYAPGPGLYAPTQDEKTFALLAHVLGIVLGFMAPLVIYLVKRESRFVSFHALQSLVWHVIYLILIFAGLIFFFISIIATVGSAHAGQREAPLLFFGMFAFIWLFAAGGWLVNLLLGIVFGIRASKGEWATIPLIGGRILRNIACG